MATETITLKLVAQDLASGNISKAIGKIDKLAKRGGIAGSVFQGVGISMGMMLNPLMLATRGIGVVTDVMGDAISAASDLSEAQSKVDVVFGDSARVIHDWADDSAQSMGIVRREALEAAGTFGNFIQALGNSREASNEMSRGIVELAADLASFNNTGIDETLVALRSGLAGEAEPLRRLGISISAARVETNILNKGIVRTKKEITDAMKVAERYAIIFEDSTLAQGDFARTSDGLANSTKILNAELETASEELGTVLLPVVRDFAVALSQDVIPSIKDAADALHEMGPPLEHVGNLLNVLMGGQLAGVTLALNREREEARKAAEDNAKFSVALQDAGPLIDEMADRARAAGPSVEQLAGAERTAAEEAKELNAALRLVADKGFKDVREEANAARKAIQRALQGHDPERKSLKLLREERERLARQLEKAIDDENVTAIGRIRRRQDVNTSERKARRLERDNNKEFLAEQQAAREAIEESAQTAKDNPIKPKLDSSQVKAGDEVLSGYLSSLALARAASKTPIVTRYTSTGDPFGRGGRGLKILHTGTDFVPETRPYLLERGERVISKEDNRKGRTGGGVTVNLNGPILGDAKSIADSLGPELVRWMAR